MGLPRNNWPVLAVAVGGWLLSWFIVSAASDVPDWLFWIWIGSKAALPIIAAFVMYRIALREADAHGRSLFAVHLTYILILLLFAPLSAIGFILLLSKPEAPGGAVQDLICVLQLMIGGVIFWLIRGGEFMLKKVFRQDNGRTRRCTPEPPALAATRVAGSSVVQFAADALLQRLRVTRFTRASVKVNEEG